MKLRKAIINGLASAAILTMLPMGIANASHHHVQRDQKIDVTRTIQVYPLQKTLNGPRIYLKKGANVTMSGYNHRYHGYIIKGEGKTYIARNRKANWYRKATVKEAAKRNVKRSRQNRKNRVKRSIKKSQRKLRRHYHVKKRNQRVLKANYRYSNNHRSLTKSGYNDLRPYGTIDVMNKYAPNDKRAVVPKKANFKRNTLWIKGYLSKRNANKGKNPIIAKGMYRAVKGGWVKLSK